jgi:hypothetical protein
MNRTDKLPVPGIELTTGTNRYQSQSHAISPTVNETAIFKTAVSFPGTRERQDNTYGTGST